MSGGGLRKNDVISDYFTIKTSRSGIKYTSLRKNDVISDDIKYYEQHETWSGSTPFVYMCKKVYTCLSGNVTVKQSRTFHTRFTLLRII